MTDEDVAAVFVVTIAFCLLTILLLIVSTAPSHDHPATPACHDTATMICRTPASAVTP